MIVRTGEVVSRVIVHEIDVAAPRHHAGFHHLLGGRLDVHRLVLGHVRGAMGPGMDLAVLVGYDSGSHDRGGGQGEPYDRCNESSHGTYTSLLRNVWPDRRAVPGPSRPTALLHAPCPHVPPQSIAASVETTEEEVGRVSRPVARAVRRSSREGQPGRNFLRPAAS